MDRCALCQGDLGDGQPQHWLECGHSFHRECLEDLARHEGVGSVEQVRCPTCRMTSEQRRQQASQLLSGSPPEPQQPAIEVIDAPEGDDDDDERALDQLQVWKLEKHRNLHVSEATWLC